MIYRFVSKFRELRCCLSSEERHILQTGTMMVAKSPRYAIFKNNEFLTKSKSIAQELINHRSHNIDYFGPYLVERVGEVGTKIDLKDGGFEVTEHVSTKSIEIESLGIELVPQIQVSDGMSNSMETGNARLGTEVAETVKKAKTLQVIIEEK